MKTTPLGFCVAIVLWLSACSSSSTTSSTGAASGGSTQGATTSGASSAAASSGASSGATAASGASGTTSSTTGTSGGSATGTTSGSTSGSSSSRLVWVPDYYGQTVNVLTGGGSTPVALKLPSTCAPNSVAVQGGQLYVACNAGTAAAGSTTDEILVYGSGVVSALVAGTTNPVTTAPSQTITSADFNSLIGMTFDPQGNLWVASYGNNEVLELTSATLGSATPTPTVNLVNSPGSPVALAFDSTDSSLWVTGQYGNGILVNFTADQQNQGANATPRYCMIATDTPGCQTAPFLGVEGLALFGGDIWVANNDTGSSGQNPGRELFDIQVVDGALSLIATYGSASSTTASPIVCPGGLFATAQHLWINDESYGESNPACGASGDVASDVGGIFDLTLSQFETITSQTPVYTNVTSRPGFGGIFIQND